MQDPFDLKAFQDLNILIADDHPLIRSALKAVVTRILPGSKVAELDNGIKVLDCLASRDYDLVILDIEMPDTNTIELIMCIRKTHKVLPILIYSMADESIYALRVIRAGATGYISKLSSVDDLEKAILQICTGKKYLSHDVIQELAIQKVKIKETPFSHLSAREFQIMSALLKGEAISSIAKRLVIGATTASTHKTRLFRKLGVKNLKLLHELAKAYGIQ